MKMRFVLFVLVVFAAGGSSLLAQAPNLSAMPATKYPLPYLKPLTREQEAWLMELDRQVEVAMKRNDTVGVTTGLERKAATVREVFGPTHEEVLDALYMLPMIYRHQKNFEAARKAKDEIISILARRVGVNHWRTQEARRARIDLEAWIKLSEADRTRLDSARSAMQTAYKLFYQGKRTEAVAALTKDMEVVRQILGTHHLDYPTTHANLAGMYLMNGEFEKAEEVSEKGRKLLEKAVGPVHPNHAHFLNMIGSSHHERGAYSKAVQFHKEALDTRRELLGDSFPEYAESLNNLGTTYREMGLHAKAAPLLREALEVRESTLGIKHPLYAQSLNNLAVLHFQRGEFAKAESLYRRSLELREKHLGKQHLDCSESLNNLANLYSALGDAVKAEEFSSKAVQIRERVLGPKHPGYGFLLMNHAVRLKTTGKNEEARESLRKAVAILKAALGEKHPIYAASLNNLGHQYIYSGAFDEAKEALETAVQVARAAVTEKHAHYSTALDNLGLLYQVKGDYPKARSLREEAAELMKQATHELHPGYARCLHDLGVLYALQGEGGRAEKTLRQALSVGRHHLEECVTILSERQRLRLLGQYRQWLYSYLSVESQAEVPVEETYARVLEWKGVVAGLRPNDDTLRTDPAARSLQRQLAECRAVLAQMAFTTPSPQRHKVWLEEIDALRNRKENLESDLAQRGAGFQRQLLQRRLGPKEIAASLPAKTALVEFLEYQHRTPPAKPGEKEQYELRLLAFVISPDHKIAKVPLGAATPIHAAIQAWRTSLRDGKSREMETAAATLAERIWNPLRPQLSNANTLLIAPDGALSQFPFGAIPGRQPGSYLLEEIAIGYVTSGRHLHSLSTLPVRESSGGLVALGGVDYGAEVKPIPVATNLAPTPLPELRERAGFHPLPGTEMETRRITQVFQQSYPTSEARLLSGAAANKERLKQTCEQRPSYLHLATHGFFESPTRITAMLAGLRGSANSLDQGLTDLETKTFDLAPFLHTGLVLAGAGRVPATGDEAAQRTSILSSEEVMDLKLGGTQLVVLSACDTGLGKLERGEGTLGLARAFHAAGARTVISSLWRIDDAATTVLMEQFYTNLWQKKMSKLEALRQAQLFVLKNPDRVTQRRKELGAELAKRDLDLGKQPLLPNDGKIGDRSHPALWAAFVLSGDIR